MLVLFFRYYASFWSVLVNFSYLMFRLNVTKLIDFFNSTLYYSYTKSNRAIILSFHVIGSHRLWNIVTRRFSSHSWTSHKSTLWSNCARIFRWQRRRSRQFPTVYDSLGSFSADQKEFRQSIEQSWGEIEVWVSSVRIINKPSELYLKMHRALLIDEWFNRFLCFLWFLWFLQLHSKCTI